MSTKAASPVAALVIVFLSIVLAALFGFFVSTAQLIYVAGLVAPIGVCVLLLLRLELVIWLMFVTATVLAGSLAYFAKISQAQWMPIGIGFVMYLALVIRLIGKRGGAAPKLPVVLGLGTLFLFTAIVTTFWAEAPFGQWIYGARYYLAMGSLLMALALLPLPEDLIRKLWIASLWVVLLQLPVTLYQYIFVAGHRAESHAAGAAWDAVVGTMGGSQEGGGLSAAMGFFVVSGFALMFSMWKRGLVGTSRMVGFTFVVLAVIFLAEVKFMVVLLPFAVAAVLRVQLLARIRQLLMGAAVVAILLLAMPTLYSKLHYERSGKPPISTSEFYEKIISGADSDKVSEDGTQMGRITQIVFWWGHHSASAQPKEFFLGHGVASTEITKLYAGDVARRFYPLQVSNTTGVLMLWDVGVAGFLIAVAAIAFASLHSLRLSVRREIPEFHRAALEAGAVILAMLLTALFYKHFALRSAAVQFLLYLSVGQACYWSARLAGAEQRQHVDALRGIRVRSGVAA